MVTQTFNMDMNPTYNPPVTDATFHRYGTDSIDFGSKYASNIKEAAKNNEPWAMAIIDAENTSIERAKYLDPKGFGKNSVYGALYNGLKIGTKFTSPDPSVRETLQQWARNLNHDFDAMKSYTPEQLAQRASDLESVVTVLNEALADLAASAEIGSEDLDLWRRVIEGLESYGSALEQLQQVLAEAPEIEVVHLDVDPRKH